MIEVQVSNCRQCLFRSHFSDHHVCLATRLGKVAGGVIALPTRLPEENVPDSIEHGDAVPRPPDWCPLRTSYVVTGLVGTIPEHVLQTPNLWPADIAIQRWELGYKYGRGEQVISFARTYVCTQGNTATEENRPGSGADDSGWREYWLYLGGPSE